MLRYMAGQTCRLIVEGERNEVFRHTFHGMTLTRIGGNGASGRRRGHDPRLPIWLRTDRSHPGRTSEEPKMATNPLHR
jgi:hypothetical protein